MSLNEKMTALADEIRELSGTTTKKGIDAMTADVNAANTEVGEQADLIAQIMAKVNSLPAAGSGGEQPTLFTPSITLQSVSSELTISDDNGGFVNGYNIYANDELIAVSTSKTVTLDEYIEHTETITIKVQAVGTNFNSSEFSEIIVWEYVNVEGTPGLLYNLSSNRAYALCIGLGQAIETNIVIASVYEGVPVTEINNQAFSGCSSLKGVTIPNCVTKIGSNAFNKCSSLTSIEIPDNVTTMETSVFSGCSSLTDVVIGNGVTSIEAFTFQSCTKLTSIFIPNNITKIWNYAFEYCESLKRVDLSSHTSIPTLGTDVFSSTSSKLQIKVPASLIDSWKNATNWAKYASKIVTEFTNEL